jgi:internalin A
MPDPEMSAPERPVSEEALKRIAECARRRVTTLDLSGLGLACLPPKLTQLAKLTDLNLSNNHLQNLPQDLGQLAKLTRLDLSHNLLRSLPPELSQLSNLTLCYLSHNDLGTLPPELCQLTNLTLLDLSNNKLGSLPPELGQLAALKRLDLSNNQLGALPPELGRLANLTRLYLSHNPLRSLPNELGQLANLTRLILTHNRLSIFPPELCRLAKLTVLDLSNNQLSMLPAEFGWLANLTELDLDNNQLECLPPELGQLAKLTVLRLVANRLAALPNRLLELAMLEKLLLHDNPALQLSPSVLGSDPRKNPAPRVASAQSILEFYFARQAGKARPLNEVKLLLVGPAGAGKTSIVQALRDLPFREREVSTSGIELDDWVMTGSGDQPVTAHVWDFAGQGMTHALHRFFFSMRSLYVLVLSGQDNHAEDDAEYWLRLIQEYATDEHGEGPPVIVALNKWNLPGCRPEVDRAALRERFACIRGFVEMDCKAKKGIPALKAALCRELERMPWVREPIPEAWDNVRRDLTTGATQRPHLTATEYRALCVEHGVQDEGQQEYLAEILHNLGVILTYRNHPLPHAVAMLQPKWLTSHLYALLRRAYKLDGVLRQSDVEMVLQQEKTDTARAYLLQSLECFAIAHALQTAAGAAWLVPQALPDTLPATHQETFRSTVDITRMRYTYQLPPDGLLVRLYVLRYDFIEEINAKKQLWRSGVILSRKGARAMICTATQPPQVTLTVIGPAATRHQLVDLCQAEMREINAAIAAHDPLGEIQVRGEWVPIV